MKNNKTLFWFIAIVMMFVAASCNRTEPEEETYAEPETTAYRKISAQEAKEIIDANTDAVILDVRTEDEFNERHIPGAILLPDYEISEKAEGILPDKDALVLVYCRTGIRSESAARELAGMGYTNVYDFGGIVDWSYEADSAINIENETEESPMPKLFYQGHGSYRITASDGTVIYIDPYAGEGYDVPADIILVTHQHGDHNQVQLCAQKPDCRIITNAEALAGGKHNTVEIDGISIQAVEASNKNHDPKQCVGYIITVDGIKIYASGDTSTTAQMETFAAMELDYAILPGDGVYNMNPEEAAECARLIGAKHNILVHIKPGALFDRKTAEAWDAPNKIIIEPGEETAL
jgi:rhodanese-related sulfurtransferase/L-ascorbate metabolism protein UlaG (beta-lactamase superfamily)